MDWNYLRVSLRCKSYCNNNLIKGELSPYKKSKIGTTGWNIKEEKRTCGESNLSMTKKMFCTMFLNDAHSPFSWHGYYKNEINYYCSQIY